MTPIVPARALSLGLAVAALSLAAAQAQAPAAPAAKPVVMTFAALRACAEASVAEEKEAARIAALDAGLKTRQAELTATAAAIEADRVTAKPRNKAQADAFNQRIDDYQKAIDTINAEVDARNAASAAMNAQVLRHNADCSGKIYSEADVAKLPPELQRIVRANGNSMTAAPKPPG
jgi:hypothetical protein